MTEKTTQTVLNIEGAPENRNLIRRILESAEYHVIDAETALEGIEKANQYHPNLILMDINLPDLDGFTTVTRIRSYDHLKSVPIIALTDKANRGEFELAKSTGYDGYLDKPVDFDELITEVDRQIALGLNEEEVTAREIYLRKQSVAIIEELERKFIDLEDAYESLKHKTSTVEAIHQKLWSNEGVSTIVFDVQQKLTLESLTEDISPYLQAIVDIQHIIAEINEQPKDEIQVLAITQGSINITLSGVTSAIELIMGIVIPWRYNHAKTMAKLTESEKLVQIENAKADILAKRLQISTERQTNEKYTIELEKQRVELEKVKLENEKLRLELHHEKVQLALEVLDKINPHLTEVEKIDYITRLLHPLEVLISSDLEPKLVDSNKES